jgi:hypothetical protein
MIEIREIYTQVEDIYHEFGPPASRVVRRGAVCAVLANPYAGRYEPEILPMMEALNPVGLEMAQRLLATLQVPAAEIEGYGKGAIVGAAGEAEHGALWHVPGGYALREVLGWKGERARGGGISSDGPAGQPGNALAIVPATKKVAGPGATLDVPVTHINASYVRTHYDAVEVRVPGAPAADEIVYILVMTLGGRVHARIGGLQKEQISKWDGLR